MEGLERNPERLDRKSRVESLEGNVDLVPSSDTKEEVPEGI